MTQMYYLKSSSDQRMNAHNPEPSQRAIKKYLVIIYNGKCINTLR